jgi:hypothetical protein
MNELIGRLLALPDGPERDAAFLEAKRLTAAWMPYKLRTHPVQVTLLQPGVVGFRRPLFWPNWFEFVDIESASRRDGGVEAVRGPAAVRLRALVPDAHLVHR